MNLDVHSVPGADPRSSVRGGVTAQRTGPRPNPTPTNSVAPLPPPTATKVSVDPMQATDRYRLVMPWANRV